MGASGKPEIAIDHWQRLGDDDPFPSLDALPVLVTLARAERDRQALEQRTGAWGVWVPGNADPEQIAERLRDRVLVAIEVTKFTDGRHYSLARLLRDRYGFTGELRAFGDVLPDQLSYMQRCGYSSFELAPGKSLETGLRCLTAFSVSYQGNTTDPRPLYRRRA
ncbi:Oxidoreductase probably involved in sulfite reduction [Enhygromyxa salina]|uniref:Oxidoreductase probably involved in sulfite reduction n=1 Tax=Enhygromyxa salina TaxID=215803 RepID=A0A0C2DED3_9BACT|nr:Oxidoreductase probably involved in sulfite reduction [Enhygromyxa salina]